MLLLFQANLQSTKVKYVCLSRKTMFCVQESIPSKPSLTNLDEMPLSPCFVRVKKIIITRFDILVSIKTTMTDFFESHRSPLRLFRLVNVSWENLHFFIVKKKNPLIDISTTTFL